MNFTAAALLLACTANKATNVIAQRFEQSIQKHDAKETATTLKEASGKEKTYSVTLSKREDTTKQVSRNAGSSRPTVMGQPLYTKKEKDAADGLVKLKEGHKK